MPTIRSLKKEAQQQLKGRGFSGIWVGFLLLCLCFIPYLKYFVSPLIISGFSYYYLGISRSESPSVKHLFLSYPRSEKVYLLNFILFFIGELPALILLVAKVIFSDAISDYVFSLLAFLFSLLLMYLLYPYRQATYILIDQPERSIMNALAESKEIMLGNKMKLFLLDFSYAIWIILLNIFVVVVVCVSVFTILIGLFRNSSSDVMTREALHTIWLFLGPTIIVLLLIFFQVIFLLYLLPRYFTAQAIFYNELIRNTNTQYEETDISSTYTQYTDTNTRSQPKRDSMGKIDYFE